MKIKNVLILTCMILLSVSLYSNSAFSGQGFPTQDYNIDVYGMGMGETGLADVYRKNTSFINPSLTSTLNQVYFSTGVALGRFNYQTKSNQSFSSEGLHFPYFNITVPIKDNYLGFSYAPLLSANLDSYSSNNSFDLEGSTYNYDEISKISSYIYKGSFLFANKNRVVNVGLSLNYYLGQRTSYWQQKFDTKDGLVDNKYEKHESFKAPGITVGINKNILNIVALGASYSTQTKLNGMAELTSTAGAVDELSGKDFTIPQQLGVGSSLRFSHQFRVNVDGYYEWWEENQYYSDPRNTYKLALGITYEPSWNHDSWLKKIPYRAGAYFRTLPFKENNAYLDETAITLGWSLPLDNPSAHLDFAIKYFQRGNTDVNTFQDRGIMFGIGFTGFDFFKNRPKKIWEREIPEAEYESFR
ncbi:MAG: hypothetical protein WCX83_05995 [Candidatus Cloacimonas sp.]|nr:hypothetical protein [Candidatus Cloacimonadota bacterium]